jgi:hypothetical protein
MTVLIAGGDSFTYGSELPSQEHAWANLLATRKGWNICNTARPAASNSSIRRNVMNAVHKYSELDLFVAVMWSFPNRYEFRFAYDTGHLDSPWYSINQANRANAEAKGMTAFAKSYVQNVAVDPYWEYYTSILEISTLQNYLLKHNINYVFAYVDDSLWKGPIDISTTTLRADIDMTKFVMDEGMFNWAKRTEQQFYTTHPRESAHIEWINMLYDRIV